MVEELLQAVVGVLGVALLPLPLGPHGLPGHLVGVDGEGFHGGQLHPFTGKMGSRELIAASQDHLWGEFSFQVQMFRS